MIKHAAECIKNGLLLKVCLFCIAFPFLTPANDRCYYFSLDHLSSNWEEGQKEKERGEKKISLG